MFASTLTYRRESAPVSAPRSAPLPLVNKRSGEPVAPADIVKGYQYEEGQYVVVSEEDMRQANVEATQTVDIEGFVDSAACSRDASLQGLVNLASGGVSGVLRSPPRCRLRLIRRGRIGMLCPVFTGSGRAAPRHDACHDTATTAPESAGCRRRQWVMGDEVSATRSRPSPLPAKEGIVLAGRAEGPWCRSPPTPGPSINIQEIRQWQAHNILSAPGARLAS